MLRAYTALVGLMTVGCLAASARGAGILPASASGRQDACPTSEPNQRRPIAGLDTVFLEEMTWMEVRDALRAGKTTALVATGGVEDNGPYVATGKHDYIIRATAEAIARRLGNAVVAPIVAFVPEGDIEPPTGHMKYPGTISVTEDTFERLLTDVCASLRAQGFKHVILLGDSGGNQQGMRAVAGRLDARWGGTARVHYIPEYYDYDGVTRWLEGQGIRQRDEGLHDDFVVTAQLMAVNPETVRMEQRIAAGCFHINGIALAPARTTIAWGKQIIAYRAETTVRAILKALGEEAKR